MRVFAGMPNLVIMVVLAVLGLGLSACGQRGPLVLPNDASARDSKAIYIIPQKTQEQEPVVENKPKQSEKVIAE